MALSKELIQLHGGKISVDSAEGVGTCFTIIMPKFHNQSLSASGNKSIEPRNVNFDVHNQVDKSKTILIVEDNPELLLVLIDILGKYYNIISAGNGKEGLTLATKKLPDLILSDILMPVMDGMKMCIEVKEHPLTSHIPVILLTAIDSEENKIKGLEIGADSYITKPFNEYVLLSNVKSLIGNREKMKQFLLSVTIFQGSSSNQRYGRGRFYKGLPKSSI